MVNGWADAWGALMGSAVDRPGRIHSVLVLIRVTNN